MPDGWDPAIYRERSARWREEAERRRPGAERDACLVIAHGYANLANLIEGTAPVPLEGGDVPTLHLLVRRRSDDEGGEPPAG